jgi:hypothetical protein
MYENRRMSLPAVFIPHQGFTDIVNCLALINYYISLQTWPTIYVIVREEARAFVEFYVRDKPSVIVWSASLRILDSIVHSWYGANIKNVYQHYRSLLNLEQYETLFIGFPDQHCTNDYKGKFSAYTCNNFVKRFYEAYGITFSTRIYMFEFTRDIDLEQRTYDSFVEKHGIHYSLTHAISDVASDCPVIELDNATPLFFDYIKILEHAQELHLLDSVWAAIVYQLAAKYGLFKDSRIVIYCKRKYDWMFKEPVELPQFEFVT